MACDVSSGMFLWVLSSKILTKINGANPYRSWVTTAAQLAVAIIQAINSSKRLRTAINSQKYMLQIWLVTYLVVCFMGA